MQRGSELFWHPSIASPTLLRRVEAWANNDIYAQVPLFPHMSFCVIHHMCLQGTLHPSNAPSELLSALNKAVVLAEVPDLQVIVRYTIQDVGSVQITLM